MEARQCKCLWFQSSFAGDSVCHSSVDFFVVVAGSSASSPPKLRTASSSNVGMWSRGMSLQYFPCILSESEVLGGGGVSKKFLGRFVKRAASERRLGASGDVLHGPINVLHGIIGRTLLNLPKILFAGSIPFDIVFVGRVVKSWGQLLSGGIQFVTNVEMLPSIPDFLQLKFGDGGGVLDDAISGGIFGFPLHSSPLLLAVVSWCWVGLRRQVLGRGYDEIGREDHVEGSYS